MTITFDQTNNYIVVSSSEILDEYILDNTIPMTVAVAVDCGDESDITYSTVAVLPTTPVHNEGYILGNEIYIYQTEVTTAIYGITLQYINAGVTKIEEQCQLNDVNEEMKCDILNAITSTDNINMVLMYEYLKNAPICGICNCTNMCTIYDELVKLIANADCNTGCSDCN